MDSCQRYIDGSINPDTGCIYPILLLIDTSETMGTFHPDVLEFSINSLFSRLGRNKYIDTLIEIAVYESHNELEYLGGFCRPSFLSISDIRYGGDWNLPKSLANCLDILSDTTYIHNKSGKEFIKPLVVVLSDNKVTEDCDNFVCVDECIANINSKNHQIPKCYFISTSKNNHFEHHLDDIKFICTNKDEVQSCMENIADEIIEVVSEYNNFGKL